jgi:hypothetical protein
MDIFSCIKLRVPVLDKPKPFHDQISIKLMHSNYFTSHRITNSATMKWNLIHAVKSVIGDSEISDFNEYFKPNPEVINPLTRHEITKDKLLKSFSFSEFNFHSFEDNTEIYRMEATNNNTFAISKIHRHDFTQKSLHIIDPNLKMDSLNRPRKKLKVGNQENSFSAVNEINIFMNIRKGSDVNSVVVDPIIHRQESSPDLVSLAPLNISERTCSSFIPAASRTAIASHIFTSQSSLMEILQTQFKMNIIEREFPSFFMCLTVANAIFLNASTCALYIFTN